MTLITWSTVLSVFTSLLPAELNYSSTPYAALTTLTFYFIPHSTLLCVPHSLTLPLSSLSQLHPACCLLFSLFFLCPECNLVMSCDLLIFCCCVVWCSNLVVHWCFCSASCRALLCLCYRLTLILCSVVAVLCSVVVTSAWCLVFLCGVTVWCYCLVLSKYVCVV
jgi:hypothetical protein